MTCDRPRTLAVLQPGYLPWLGFFDQIRRCDVFVLYDDVQFDKHGWRNRNRIKGPDGVRWLTVPVLHRERHGQRILDVQINEREPWRRKHVEAMRHHYARAPHRDDFLPAIQEILEKPWDRLVELDVALIERICAWLGLAPDLRRSSELGVEGGRVDRLVALCRELEAERYLTGDAARDYLDEEAFRKEGIEVEWQAFRHPVYPQLHGEFVSHLSVVDLLFNCGDRSASYLQDDLRREIS